MFATLLLPNAEEKLHLLEEIRLETGKVVLKEAGPPKNLLAVPSVRLLQSGCVVANTIVSCQICPVLDTLSGSTDRFAVSSVTILHADASPSLKKFLGWPPALPATPVGYISNKQS